MLRAKVDHEEKKTPNHLHCPDEHQSVQDKLNVSFGVTYLYKKPFLLMIILSFKANIPRIADECCLLQNKNIAVQCVLNMQPLF